MPDTPYQLAQQFRAALLQRDADALREITAIYDRLVTSLQLTVSALGAEAQRARAAGQTVNAAWLFRERRLQRLLDQAEQQLATFTAQLNARLTNNQQAAVLLAQEHARQLLSAADAETTFTRLPTNAIETIVGFSGDGAPLTKLLNQLPGDATARIRETLIAGIATGQNPRQTASQIKDALQGNLARAQTIARTECLPGDTVIDGAVIEAIYRRWYEGDLVEIITKSGRQFSATPNHPMLTNRGWVAAGKITQSDYLVCNHRQKDLSATGNEYIEGRPSTLSQIFDSLSAVGISERRCGGKPDFHGDGMEGDVEVLSPDRPLLIGSFAPLYEPLIKQILSPSDFSGAPICRVCKRLLSIDKQPCRCIGADWSAGFFEPSANRSMGYSQVLSDLGLWLASEVSLSNLFDVNAGVKSPIISSLGSRLAPIFTASTACPSFGDDFADRTTIRIEADGNLFHRDAGSVELDHVVFVRLRTWRGHIFNLSTPYGYFTANTLYTGNTLRAYREASRRTAKAAGVERWEWIASKSQRTCLSCLAMDGRIFSIEKPQPSHPNCRCQVLYLPPSYTPPPREMGAQWFEKQPDEVKAKMMSKVAFEALKRGEVTLQDFVGVRRSRVWGETRYERSYKDILQAAQKRATKTTVPTPQWKPVMNRKDAEKWARQSVWKDDVFHVTRPENISSLEQTGFDLRRVGLGRVWGNGVYAGTDEATRKMYEQWTGGTQNSVALTLKIRVRNVFTFDAAKDLSGDPILSVARMFPQGEQEFEGIAQEIVERNLRLAAQSTRMTSSEREEYFRENDYVKNWRGEALTQFLKSKGYDALHVKDQIPLTLLVGGNQIVVFDPRNVVILTR